MNNRTDTLKQYVSDMLAVERHIHEPVKRQRDDENTRQHPQAHQLLTQLESILDEHIANLERHLESLGGSVASPVKDAVTSVAGVAAGLYDKMRSEKLSKMLRDDYTALSLAAISYTMLHTTGLALNDQRTADLSLRHLQHWTPMIVQISEIIPGVVVKELTDDVPSISTSVTQQAVRNTQQMWSREAVS
ncbi:MAG: hypothetical protein U0401_15925 [Anaerolineae bacterium]